MMVELIYFNRCEDGLCELQRVWHNNCQADTLIRCNDSAMSESVTTESPELQGFDLNDSPELRELVSQLPLRAIAAFNLRCEKRREPLQRLKQLQMEAFAGGVTGYNGSASNGKPSTLDFITAITARDAELAAATDLKIILNLNLGKPGDLGEPIRWDDPRLGPLWPDGVSESSVKVERECRDLEEKLNQLSSPSGTQDDVELHPQIGEWRRLEAMYTEGRLDEYRGEFVIWANGEIFAHGRKLLSVRLQAEKLAEAKGISPDHLINYFVAGE
jgi:hypothetical protein